MDKSRETKFNCNQEHQRFVFSMQLTFFNGNIYIEINFLFMRIFSICFSIKNKFI